MSRPTRKRRKLQVLERTQVMTLAVDGRRVIDFSPVVERIIAVTTIII